MSRSTPSAIPQPVNVLGVSVHPISMDEALDVVDGWIERGEKHYVCPVPIHNILSCQDDPELKQVFKWSGMTIPDGMPMGWIARVSGHPKADRVYGPDLMPTVSRMSAGSAYCHFLF